MFSNLTSYIRGLQFYCDSDRGFWLETLGSTPPGRTISLIWAKFAVVFKSFDADGVQNLDIVAPMALQIDF